MMHELVAQMRMIDLEPNTVVMEQGEEGNVMYILQTGLMSVERDGAEVDEIKPGQQVGELAILFNETRTATIKTKEHCILWALDREVFQTIQASRE
jgi:cGMP-dependent protein kinase 1